MLGTQGLHQGSHFVVIVSRHRGEKASGGTGQSVASTPLLPPLPTRAPSLRPGSPAPPYSLVLNLEVEVPTKPVIEGGLVDVACCLELEGKVGESMALGARSSPLQVTLYERRGRGTVPGQERGFKLIRQCCRGLL